MTYLVELKKSIVGHDKNGKILMRQQVAFLDGKEQYISIAEAAKSINVSSASIRNWVKAGYLVLAGKNMVSVASFESFKEDVAGLDKLVNRANKSLKDNHDHDELSESFKILIKNNDIDSSKLGREYEESLSSSHRNKEGVYYTPSNIAERFFKNLPADCSKLTFYDPCCGSGNFLMAAIKKGFKPENIYGLDVDPIAVEITRKRIADIIGCMPKNITCGDFLDEIHQENNDSYDVIATNPPWGKKIEKARRDQLAKFLRTGFSKDTSSLFFFACLNKLKSGGVLGLLLQDAFFNINTFKDARKKALSIEIKEFIDFGKPFKGLLTKAKGIVLEKNTFTPSKSINPILCEGNSNIHYREQESFITNSKLVFNFSCTQNESDVIEHLFKTEHQLLAGNASFGLGIVTGNNKKHCESSMKDGLIAVYKGSEIHQDKLDQATCYISKNFSKYQQVAPINLFLAKEKLIYRFISSNLIFFHDTKQRIVLNSANMIVLNENFPISVKQLSNLLNSRIINWLFKTLFDTHKVLRADIESLPIHVKYFDHYQEFSEKNYLAYLGIEEVSI